MKSYTTLYGWAWWMNTICIFIRTFVYTFVSFDRAHEFHLPLSSMTDHPSIVVDVRVRNCMQKFKYMPVQTHTHIHIQYVRLNLRLMSNFRIDDCWLLPNILFCLIPKNSLFCKVHCLKRMVCYSFFLLPLANRSNQFTFNARTLFVFESVAAKCK